VFTDLRNDLEEGLGDTYSFERELAGGGMSRVFLARERALGRRVVVKMLRPDYLAGVNAERFKREIQLTARLQHPNIVPILSTGEVDGIPFYTMPFEEGDSLRVRLARTGALPIPEAVSILRDVARALEFAHDRGVIHRDIKPENVLLAGSTATVADFGVAKALATSRAVDDVGTLTDVGFAIGTPQYMAPEQAAADSAVDHRADLYAFGCMAFEMLAGEPPFQGPPAAQIRAHLILDPAPIATKRADVPEELATLVARCLEKDPDHRPAGSRELIAVLDRTAAGGAEHPASAPRTGPANGAGLFTIAVLPFANLSPDADTDYLADGLTDELITDLSMLKTLRVISRQSAMRLKGSDKDVRTIARELGTRYVLTGGVRKSGLDVRITAQLVDAEVDAQLWAEKFSGTFDHVLDMQERLSRQIVDALRLRLTPEEARRMAHRSIADARAYDLYLRARQQIWSFSGPALDRALQLIREAQEIVGDSELLIAAEGMIYWQYVNVGLRPASAYDDYLGRAEACATRIFALNPESSKGYSLRAAVRNNRADPVGSMRDFKRALALDPNDPEALLWLGYAYGVAGQIPMAVAFTERLLQVDPLTSINLCMRGMVAMFDGRYDDALRWTQRSVDIDPENPTSRMVHALMLAANGRVDEAVALLRPVARDTPDMAWAKLGAAMAGALRGDRDEVLRVMTPELREAAWRDDLFCWWSADCFALVGEREASLDFLERAVSLGIVNHPFLAAYEPFLAGVRGEARFGRLLERVRRAWEVFQG
jgi:serine/threonine protein kinase/tetratricopeptide (TPR) repeat protein